MYGEWSELELELFKKFIQPGDIVLDIGANIGAFTIPFAKFVGTEGQVFAYEAQTVLTQMISTSALLNLVCPRQM